MIWSQAPCASARGGAASALRAGDSSLGVSSLGASAFGASAFGASARTAAVDPKNEGEAARREPVARTSGRKPARRRRADAANRFAAAAERFAGALDRSAAAPEHRAERLNLGTAPLERLAETLDLLASAPRRTSALAGAAAVQLLAAMRSRATRFPATRLRAEGRGLARGALAAWLFGAASIGGAAAQSQAEPEPPSGFAPGRSVFAAREMVVAAHPLAAEAALAMLRAGGSAADAGIAAQLALAVVEPQSSGLGGGAFALYWRAATGRLSAWDGRETAPAAATPALFEVIEPAAPPTTLEQIPGQIPGAVIDGVAVAPELTAETGLDGAVPAPTTRRLEWAEAVASGLAIGAPGAPHLLESLHERFGALDWDDLAEPAIRLAEGGFPISPRLAASIAEARDKLAADPAAAALFLDAAGAPRAAGEMLANPALAETLREFADDGAEAIQEGDIAEAILAAAARPPRPGLLSEADLASYRAIERQPVCTRYRDRYEVCGMGPPSSGGVGVGQMLGLLDHFPLKRLGAASPQGAHLFLEASRLAYADRDMYLADPDFVSVPAVGLLDPTYLLMRAQAIDPSLAALGPARAGNPPWREARLGAPDRSDTEAGTTHLTVVDRAGDVFVLTSSIESSFGSGRMAAGMLLNHQLTDFSFAATENGLPIANAPGPRKRPRSTMAPTIVFDVSSGVRRPILALGSPGGSRIVEYVAGAIVDVLDHGLLPADAAARPHLSHRNRSAVAVEARGDADRLAAELEGFGHRVERAAMTSGLHIVGIAADGGLTGGADPRREGVALGD